VWKHLFQAGRKNEIWRRIETKPRFCLLEMILDLNALRRGRFLWRFVNAGKMCGLDRKISRVRVEFHDQGATLSAYEKFTLPPRHGAVSPAIIEPPHFF
jgi:hypothetical protein